MKMTNLIIAVESEKLAALNQYAAKKGVEVNAELTEAIERLYEKHVPAAVREYLDNKPAPKPSRPPRPRREPRSEVSNT